MNKGHPDRNERAFAAVEAMLSHLHRRDDMGPAMQNARFRFGSANAMFAADRHIWQQLGFSRSEALLFSRLMDITRYVERKSYDRHMKLSRLQLVSDFIASNFYGLQVERFYVFCLNQRGGLKERIFLHEGTAEGTLFNMKKLLGEIVRIAPSAVIFSHNHPGETLRPSQEDIHCTQSAMYPLSMVGIPVLDHLIVAGRQVISMRENGFIPEVLWLNQAPDNRMLRDWLYQSSDPSTDANGSANEEV